MPGLPFQRTVKLREIKRYSNTKYLEPITEEIEPVHRNNESFPNITGLPYPTSEEFVDISDSLSNCKRGRYFYKKFIRRK